MDDTLRALHEDEVKQMMKASRRALRKKGEELLELYPANRVNQDAKNDWRATRSEIEVKLGEIEALMRERIRRVPRPEPKPLRTRAQEELFLRLYASCHQPAKGQQQPDVHHTPRVSLYDRVFFAAAAEARCLAEAEQRDVEAKQAVHQSHRTSRRQPAQGQQQIVPPPALPTKSKAAPADATTNRRSTRKYAKATKLD
ncbi:hypothetical protein CALVIDRAFT_559933 [Calocera viscosa TUFC12733]|uniref:Uncharacterized protein n=1 Tax=Calocera viscosa (strain TUFC12733) TaxID=1330018 RepID=A0A167RV11_CALVF|nr:hypothetical protein CALVIDRAFT_559933 [Calocera viscosa TUFC12733]